MTVDVNGYHNKDNRLDISVLLLNMIRCLATHYIQLHFISRPRGEETDSDRQHRKNRLMMGNGQMQREGGTDVPG